VCASVTWRQRLRLLAPGFERRPGGPRGNADSETRLARSLSYRLHSAEQTKKAVGALGLAPQDDLSELGEVPEAVMEDVRGAQIQ
jgi:hypothetical protein